MNNVKNVGVFLAVLILITSCSATINKILKPVHPISGQKKDTMEKYEDLIRPPPPIYSKHKIKNYHNKI